MPVFKIDVDRDAESVEVYGSWDDWKSPLVLRESNYPTWEAKYSLDPGHYEFKFKVDHEWMASSYYPVNDSHYGNNYTTVKSKRTDSVYYTTDDKFTHKMEKCNDKNKLVGNSQNRSMSQSGNSTKSQPVHPWIAVGVISSVVVAIAWNHLS
eukprot:NODE_281_length_11904_cov_0.253452.p6 type:complete len:152 gc:universal NODE_281_length_11904_cov_0.253452:7554-8009(+)